jgi:hypothetical protein
MTDAPERIWILPEFAAENFASLPGSPYDHRLFAKYVRADLVERAILDAQLRAFERDRLDTPDEIRSAALQIREGRL